MRVLVDGWTEFLLDVADEEGRIGESPWTCHDGNGSLTYGMNVTKFDVSMRMYRVIANYMLSACPHSRGGRAK